MHAIGGARAGALGVKSLSALPAEQGLGHLAAGGIAGAEKQNGEHG